MGSLPVELVATLVLGLRDNSRLKMALRGETYTFEQVMMVKQYDALQINAYLKTEDARKGRRRPKMLMDELMKANTPSEFKSFDTVEELQKAIERSKHA